MHPPGRSPGQLFHPHTHSFDEQLAPPQTLPSSVTLPADTADQLLAKSGSPRIVLRYSDNPPITPAATDGASIFRCGDQSPAPWAAAYTKPRQEKALAADLLDHGVDYFLPLVERVTVSGGRRRRGLYPLFASYLFFKDTEEGRTAVFRTDRVAQLVSPPAVEQPRFVREMQAIEQALLECPEDIELHPHVVEGAHVRVTGGALKGAEGIVANCDTSLKIWLKMTALGTGVLVQVHADLIESSG